MATATPNVALAGTATENRDVVQSIFNAARSSTPHIDDSIAVFTSDHSSQATLHGKEAHTGSAADASVHHTAICENAVRDDQASFLYQHEQGSDMRVSPSTQVVTHAQSQTPTQTDNEYSRLDDHNFMSSLPFDILDFTADVSGDFATNNLLSLPHDDQLLPYTSNFGPRNDFFLPASELPSGMQTPQDRRHRTLDMSAQAFQESVWLWIPTERDHGAAELKDLDRIALPHDAPRIQGIDSDNGQLCKQRIDELTRSAMLAVVLSTADRTFHRHILANFPSPDLLTSLINKFLDFHVHQDMTWIHPASINLTKETPVFLISLLAYGALLSPNQNIRKLGYAMQEAVRLAGREEVG